MAEAAVASPDRIGVRIAELPTLRWDSFGDPQQPTAEFFEDLLTALQRFGSVALSIAAAQRIAARPNVFDPWPS